MARVGSQEETGPLKTEKDSGPERNLSYLFFALAVATGVFIFLALFQRSFGPPEIEDLRVSPLPSEDADNFRLESLTGQAVSLRDFRGRVVFLNFWATWCEPCKVEMPLMQRLYNNLKEKGLVVVAVDLRDHDRVVRQFVQDLGLTFPVLLDRDGSVSKSYRVTQIPTSYLIDREGKLVGKVIGPRDWSNRQALRLFDQLLAR